MGGNRGPWERGDGLPTTKQKTQQPAETPTSLEQKKSFQGVPEIERNLSISGVERREGVSVGCDTSTDKHDRINGKFWKGSRSGPGP